MKLYKFLPILVFGFAILSGCTEDSGEQSPDAGSQPHIEQDTGVLSQMDTVMGDSTGPNSQTKPEELLLEGGFTQAKAMEMVYGLYDKNIECSKWVCTVQERPGFEGKMDKDGQLYSRAAGFYPFETSEGKGVFLITETLSRESDGWESCHSCAPVLGAAEFTLAENEWVIKNLKKDMGTYGAWGELPQKELMQIGPNRYGIHFEEGYTAQGISEGNSLIVGEFEGQFSLLGAFHTSYSNTGFYFEGNHPERAYEYNSVVTTAPGGNPEYHDILVKTSGFRPVAGDPETDDILDFEEERVFALEDGRYVLADSVVRLIQ